MKIQQGIDITSVDRMKQAAQRRPALLARVFTEGERRYCESKRMKYEHYAARFAAKEAAMKAFEIRRRNRYRFRDIEVKHFPTGKPFLYLTDEARKRFGVQEACQLELSIAHERAYAIASVLSVTP